MKKEKTWLQAMKNNRKFRCGGFSAALTAAVVICALLVGAAADALEDRYALRADCSFNGAATQGAVTNAVLDQLEKDVHIYAVVPVEGGDATLLSLLERYQAASDHVTVSRENLVRNPVLLTQFSDALGGSQVTDDCLIVSCPETGRARVLNEDDYYIYSYNMETGYFDEAGFTYEKSVTEAILYVTQDELPVIQVLTGHGEMPKSDVENLEDTLVSANYQVKRVNLAAGGVLDADSPLMILSPQYDVSEGEMAQLMEFARAGGDFFIVSQYSDPLNLDHYQAFLRTYGVEMYPGLVIAKASDTAGYYGDLPVYLMPRMQETEATRPLLSAEKTTILLAGARAFRLPDSVPAGLQLSSVLMTGDAYIRNYADGVSLSEQQPTDEAGVFPVALWADKMMENGAVSQLFIIGNLTAFVDYWEINNTHSSALLLQVMRTLQGKDPVNLDILPVNALRAPLSLGSLAPAAAVAALLPLLVLLGAALVLLPRKNL